MTTEEKTKPMNDFLDQALKNYEQAWRTGARIQEESVRFFGNVLAQAGPAQGWPKQFKTAAEELIPQAQKNLEDGLKLLEQQSRASVELVKKACSAAQAASPQEAQTRLLGLWEASVNTMRETIASAQQVQQKATESWMAYARKAAETTAAPAGNPTPGAPKP